MDDQGTRVHPPWIAGLAVLVLLEKVLPVGGMLARTVGVGFVASGIARERTLIGGSTD
jgi:predicted metal-binding membrane protein